MGRYFRNKNTSVEKIHYGDISNGVLLTDFTEKGHALSNSYMQLFVTDEELIVNWEPFVFSPKLNPSEEDLKAMVGIARKLLYEMNNYGLMFQDDMGLDEFTYLDGEHDLVRELFTTDFSQFKSFDAWYRDNIIRYLSSDDESEYGYTLDGILSQAKVLVDSLKAVAQHFQSKESV